MRNKIGWLKILICAAALALFGAAFCLSPTSKTSAFKTSENDSENPQNCAACHQENYDSWHRTAHQKTVRKATVENVQGDFERENELEYGGVKAEMTRGEENFFITIGDDKYKIESVVGAKYIEQYVARKNGELYSLPVGYNLTEKRWINLNDADFEGRDADFSRHLKNWKTDCAVCHRSGENDLPSGFGEFGISCSACHGNAAEHVAAKNSVWAKIGLTVENKIVNPRDLNSDASMMICAQCHAADSNDAPEFEPFAAERSADNLISAHRKNAADSERFWLDGSSKFSGNEYRAIVRSVCYVQSKSGGGGIAGEKINCAICHSQHEKGGEISAAKSDNRSCIECHAQFAGDAAIVEHTKHPLDSEASSCVSCHQPETVYGRMRFSRTHEISVPNPFLTVEKQVPNACNLCHTDKSVNWAIASSKQLWAERFRNAAAVSDRQYDEPEGVRALSSNDAFLRALAADSLRKHSNTSQSASFLSEAYRTKKSSFVRYFLDGVLKNDAPKSSAAR